MREKKFHHFCETSAMTGENVRETFETLAKHLYLAHKSKLEQYVSLSLLRECRKKKTISTTVS